MTTMTTATPKRGATSHETHTHTGTTEATTEATTETSDRPAHDTHQGASETTTSNCVAAAPHAHKQGTDNANASNHVTTRQ